MKALAWDTIESSYLGGLVVSRLHARTVASRDDDIASSGLGNVTARTYMSEERISICR